MAKTTTITWSWGTNSVIAFDPASDILDFGWFQAGQFTVSEVNGSVVISIPTNNQTYTLTGVTLSELSLSNILAKDSGAVTEWTTALGGASAGSGGSSGGATSGGATSGGTSTGGSAGGSPASGTTDGGTSGSSGGAGHVGDGLATVTTISWAWGTHTALNFDTALDKLDFGWLSADNFTVSEVNGSVVIAIPSNSQTYTLTGVTLSELSLANIVAKDGSALAEWTTALSGHSGGSSGTSGGSTGGSTSGGGSSSAGGSTSTGGGSTGGGSTGGSSTGGSTGGTSGGGTSGGDAALYAEAWSASKVYQGGDHAAVGNNVYEAHWWTQGTDPSTHNGGDGSGQVWTLVGHLDTTTVVPNAPADLFATNVSDTSALLVWDKAVINGAGTVSAYEIYENGTLVGTTSGTSYKVTGLGASTAYSFTVVAVDEAGHSPAAVPISVTTDPVHTSTLEQTYSPYIDMSLSTSQDLLSIAKASGVTDFTLAFVLSSGTDTLGWGGVGTLGNDTLPSGSSIHDQVAAVQAIGGDITISFGGANGQEAALTFSSATKLTAAYQSVLDTYHVNKIDFDIEGGAIANTSANHLRDQALVALEAANPDLKVSFTLPVLPTGLTNDGLNLLKQALTDGVHIDTVNIMAMDYGASVDSGDMGTDAISAAQATLAQMHTLGLDAKLGVTVMVGMNDVQSEVFTLSDAQQLLDYAQGNEDISGLSIWSVGRDNGSTVGTVSPLGSGIQQTAYEFSHIFGHI
ncbi:type III fibronectin [Azorhizobium caulinodans ORS 571]|uniref:Type III fibronectin n=1 Tax=Azorhizobium caulinodans (strain ATCC 43989 / DSM 5975 / JCM 20966 / LMG 6465 / NBRC 14845 / NCIMB 13405 / ORS 571) TaxID=438753 RepID=A8IDA6_AZOC5|nr:fibronectin type III domain-containing protein [Azorhizobium caulinodans]BAF88899.1 type III fibronectin [Azorhizobium caulinodans ORS 571]